MKAMINGTLWELCPVPGCRHGVCYALNSDYCYPHTISKDILDHMLEENKEIEDNPATSTKQGT